MTAPSEAAREPLAELETEGRNPRTRELDTLPTETLLAVMHAENTAALDAVQSVLPPLTKVVELLAERMAKGGRLFYVGAGTSGRLGVLDASECPPTFGVLPEVVQGIIAGGQAALTSSMEGAEDSPEQGADAVRERSVGRDDVVVGIAASGRTPYVLGALQAAREAGAFTVALANVSQPVIGQAADITLAAVTGPEVVTGSTRLKAGTAQKLILNLLTTGVMVRLGKVYGNLMVDVRASNVKLRDRAIRIVMAAVDVDRSAAEETLNRANGECKTAIVMLRLGLSASEAEQRLHASDGHLRRALDAP